MKRLGALLLGALVVTGCGGSNDNGSGDMAGQSNPQKACTANAKECVSTQLARVCPSDGAGWLAVQCATGMTCMNGDCVAGEQPDMAGTPAPICTAGDKVCTSDGKVGTCNSAGTAYTTADCPTGTACVGDGLCAGACIVGSSYCLAPDRVSVCSDGASLTTTACGSGTACVQTGDTPFTTSACKPAECTPGPDGCGAVCGNKQNPSADQSKFISQCVETPNGWKWVPINCIGAETCNPSASLCADGTNNAACTVECKEGDGRCTDLTTFETCVGGKWVPQTACTGGGTLQVCVQTGSHAACGDPTCKFGSGACAADGKFLPCVDGKLSATGTACATGACINDAVPVVAGTPIYLPVPSGSCHAECQAGESQCAGGAATGPQFVTCVNGRWSASTACEASTCYATTTATGLRSHVCGACVPNTHTCDGDQIATCDATGKLGDFVDCPVGRCQGSGGDSPLPDATCVMDCVPNQLTCAGNDANPGWTVIGQRATTASATCTDKGTFPDSLTLCTDGTQCEYTTGGKSLGCVQCAGVNEFGFPDSGCDGDLYTCKSDNTWDDGVSCGDVVCNNARGPFPSAPIGQPYCHTIYQESQNGGNPDPQALLPTSDSFLKVFTLFQTRGQVSLGCDAIATVNAVDAGAPLILGTMRCQGIGGQTGMVEDCCAFACFADPLPGPAWCGPEDNGYWRYLSFFAPN